MKLLHALSMTTLISGVDGVAGQIHAQTVQGAAVHAGKQHGGVHIATLEVGQLVHSCCGKLAGSGRAGQGDQDLVGMQTGVLAVQIVGLEGLDRLDGSGADQIRLLRDARQILERIDQGACGSAQQRAGLAGDDSSMAAAGAPPVASLRACACFSTSRAPMVSPA